MSTYQVSRQLIREGNIDLSSNERSFNSFSNRRKRYTK